MIFFIEFGDFMTPKQKKFANLYIKYLNASRAAREAGYSLKTADRTGSEYLKKPEIKAYIDKQMAEKNNEEIASADEVLKFLTDMMRGNIPEEVVVVESCGDYLSKAKNVKKSAQPKDKNKAAELLGKRYRLFEDKEQNKDDSVKIVDDINDKV